MAFSNYLGLGAGQAMGAQGFGGDSGRSWNDAVSYTHELMRQQAMEYQQQNALHRLMYGASDAAKKIAAVVKAANIDGPVLAYLRARKKEWLADVKLRA